MTSPSTIAVNDLTVAYGTNYALQGVTASFAPATSTALVGSNGSGKTTLLHVLAGLVAPSSGSVQPNAPEVAYVLQQRGAHAWLPLTVDEVLAMARYRARGLTGRLTRSDKRAISHAAARLEIENLRRRQFGQLSGGQRQRVLVAQAIAQQAPVLLMDEPITGLDLPSQGRILDIIDEETDAGHTVIITTHHLEEAHHCDQVLVLANRVIASGTPEATLTPDVLREAYSEQLYDAHEGHDHPVAMILTDQHDQG